MPIIFRQGSLIVHFWTNEGEPLEPIHIHISSNNYTGASSKYWLSKDGKFISDKNNDKRNRKRDRELLESFIKRDGVEKLINEWIYRFKEIRFYDE